MALEVARTWSGRDFQSLPGGYFQKRRAEMPEERHEGDPQGDLEEPGKMSLTPSEPESAQDLDAMQAELVQLRQQVDEHQVAARARQRRGRGWAVGLLLVLGLVLLAAGNVTFWLRGTVLNTNRWVSAVGPLSQNKTVANAVSIYAVGGLFDLVDVEQAIGEAVPPKYSFLRGVIARSLQNLAQDTATSLIQSDQFNTVWVGLNRAAHRAIIGVLRGNGDLVYLRDGQLTVDLSDALKFVTDSFNLGELEPLQDVQTRFVLLESRQVAAVQQGLGLVDGVGLVMPLLALGSLFLAWLLSLWRRRTVLWIGIGVGITMVLSLIAFALTQPAVLASIPDPFVRLLAGEIWDVVVRGLYVQTILVLVVGLILIAGAALAGPSAQAIAVRTGIRNGWDRLWKR
jgi:hypothetical protein